MANRSSLGIEADTFPMPQGSPRLATTSSSTVEKVFSHTALVQRGCPKVFGCAGGHVFGKGRWVIVYGSMIGRLLASKIKSSP